MITQDKRLKSMKDLLEKMLTSSSNISKCSQTIADNPNQSEEWYSNINSELILYIEKFQIARTYYMEFAVYTAQHK